MRGTGHTLSRLPVARSLARWALMSGAAVLAATALFAGAVPKAYGQIQTFPEETAMAVARPLLPGGAMPRAAGLPAVLAPSDAARLRRLFALQASGQIAAAIREAAALDSAEPVVEAVLGHVLADRHLGPHTRTSGAELAAWLARWPDLPDAPAIHALLARRLAPGQALPAAPPRPAGLGRAPEPDPAEAAAEADDPAAALPPRQAQIDQAVRDAARNGRPGAAARVLSRAGALAPGHAALLRGEAAQILFARNRDREALEIAAPGASGAALAGHWAGLAAWRLGHAEQAATLFQAAWHAELATPAQRAAAAFWAARAHLRADDPANHALWLSFAAQEPHSFHGLVARRMLGLALEDGALPRETLGEADLAAIAAHPGGLRALALIQIGRRDRAEAELRQLWPAAVAAPGLGRALMLVADQAGLHSLAVQLADLLDEVERRPRARFLVPRLRPAGGFTADPALVYAIARIESNFDPTLVSPAGARGLMQLMPGTARFLAGIPAGTEDEPAPLPALHDPAVNLSLGQRYLNFLATTEAVGGDKLRLLAAYNAGPSAMARWAAAIRDQGDPFLFLEAIPIDETRAFVPRVLAHTWRYASRMRLPTPSLDDLAAGQWPRYLRPDPAEAAVN